MSGGFSCSPGAVPRSRPVEERSHLASLAEYLAKQPTLHRLGTSDRVVHRIARCEPDPSVVRAICRQLALEQALRPAQ